MNGTHTASEMLHPAITLRQVRKAYGKTRAVKDSSLTVAPGTLVALLGPSGCGKTTTLRLIAGLEKPDSGDILINGQLVAGAGRWVEPEDRRIGMIFQDYALFPHLDIRANIGYGLRGWSKADRARREDEMMALVGLNDMAARYPHQLSGGQQQRVALARSLAAEPAVLLMDEPFSNLDATLRVQMRSEVRSLVKRLGATTVLVTHDQQEALSLADLVVVMFDGNFVQVGAPLDIYLRPVNQAVATFVGEANLLPGIAHGDTVDCALGKLPLVTAQRGAVDVMIRPESITPFLDPDAEHRIEEIVFLGHDLQLQVRLQDGSQVVVRTRPHASWAVGEGVRLTVPEAASAYPHRERSVSAPVTT
ncbi:MAG: ABC transporter ATP-binding protein [Caldilineaceae bacterium]